MNSASIVAICIIIVVLGFVTLHGTLRGVAGIFGIIVGTQVSDKIYATQLANGNLQPGPYLIAFLGIFIGCMVAGFLIYGATKFEPIESFEGVFGFLCGIVVSWGLARFVLSYMVFYNPTSALAVGTLEYNSIAWHVYTISPYYDLMNMPIAQSLRNPKI